MKIESIRIENFRSFEDKTVYFDDYTCLVGPNGGGKSTVLVALNIFFRDIENSDTDVINLSEEDFHYKDTSKPIKITVTFIDLNEAAQVDFKDYFRQGKLIISAIAKFNTETGKAIVEQQGQRLGMFEFRPFFKKYVEGVLVKELLENYKELQDKFSDLPLVKTKDAMKKALSEYESTRPDQCILIPSSDQFYGISKGRNRLEKYVQWIYIPAVKDIIGEQSEGKATILGKILFRTIRQTLNFDKEVQSLQKKTEIEYNQLLKSKQVELKKLEGQLQERLKVWAHPDASAKLSWQDAEKLIQISQPTAQTKVTEGGFEGDLARLGHGFQRSYLLALLEVLANSNKGENTPTLLLACEEPELYQHPPQARHLSSVLEKLSSQTAQVFVTTHYPAFVTGQGFESVRLIRFDAAAKASQISQLTFDQVAGRMEESSGKKPIKSLGVVAKLHQELQPALSEIFFTKNLILVEGLEDLAIIKSWIILTDRWNEFRRRGMHIVSTNGKSHLKYPLIIAQGMKIPVFTVFDADGQETRPDPRKAHEENNKILFNLLGISSKTAFPDETLWGDSYVIWAKNITEVIKQEIPVDKLGSYNKKANDLYGCVGGLQKNSLHIAAILRQAFEDGIKLPSLEKLCDLFLSKAKV